MAKDKYRYYHSGIDAPSVLVAAASLAIWTIWPDVNYDRLPHELPPSRVSTVDLKADDSRLIASPDLFALPSPMGFSGPDFSDSLPEIPSAPANRRTHFLQQPAGDRAIDATSGHHASSGILQDVRSSFSGYVHPTDGMPVFERTSSPEMRLIVDTHGDLRKYGFVMPPLSDDDIKYLDREWSVSLVIDINDDGAVENVFVENGCDDHRINDMVIRMVSKGELSQPGTRCSGRMTVNFGTW